ncbi:MAG: copper resistance protein CopC/CopD [Actinomycetota bacterium]|nr:copper resistance protein CopC/CopD [Actinomycetota bacterium]
MSAPLRLLLVGAAAAAIALAASSIASAHSELVATEPRSDAVVQEAPPRVLVRFNEPVETALGALEVYDGVGDRVDTGELERPKPSELAVAVKDGLDDGTYTVAWRVVSADSDPISGAFVFHVGAPGSNPSGIAATVVKDSPALVDVLYTGGRFFEFALILLCAGGIAALVYALRSADGRLHRRLYGVLAVSAGGLAFWSLLGIPLQAAEAEGTDLGSGFAWQAVRATAETRYGEVELIRAGLSLAILAAALLLRRSRGRSPLTQVLAAGSAAALVVTPAFAGHASTAGAVAVAADVAHVVAAATWVGGLGFVVVALWFALEERWPLATRAVPRFSTMAVLSVAVLLVAGTINGYLEIRAWRGLWDTEYGLLLLAKVALVLPLLGLGAYNNRYAVPRLRTGVAQPGERRRFLQAAGVELFVMASIVTVTAVLVNTNPAKHALAEEHAAAATQHGHQPGAIEGGPTETQVNFGSFAGTVSIHPGTAGPNTVTLALDHEQPNFPNLAEVAFRATLVDRKIGPLTFEATSPEHGLWQATGADLSIPGEWELEIEARRGEFDLFTETIHVPIGGKPE